MLSAKGHVFLALLSVFTDIAGKIATFNGETVALLPCEMAEIPLCASFMHEPTCIRYQAGTRFAVATR